MITVRRYGSRYHAVYDDDELLVVCLYRVGARAVKRRIDALEAQLRSMEGTGPGIVMDPSQHDGTLSCSTPEAP